MHKEKYIEWTTVSIPKIYFDHICSYLKHSKKIASVSEFMRRFMDAKLKEFIEESLTESFK